MLEGCEMIRLILYTAFEILTTDTFLRKSQHEDSAGHKGTIEAGGVQWMCAGRGIIHAEMPVHTKGAPDPRGLQLWVDLPKQFKMVVCSFNVTHNILANRSVITGTYIPRTWTGPVRI
jgi:redox-sensitive bicupin YhaK (pirin superfamily)